MAAAAVVAVTILALSCNAFATQFIVGESSGWTDPGKGNVSYAEWALKHRYHVGDSLVFNYAQDSHSVVQVNRQDFDTCHTANSIATFKDGASVVHLTRAGPYWFICGETSHCSMGQKFGIMVVQRRGHHRAQSPAPAPAPSSGGSSEILPAPHDSSAASPEAGPVSAPALAPITGAAATASSIASAALGLLGVACYYALLL